VLGVAVISGDELLVARLCSPLCFASSVPLSPTPLPRGERGSSCGPLCFVSSVPLSPTSLTREERGSFCCRLCSAPGVPLSLAPRGGAGSRAFKGSGEITGLVTTRGLVVGNELGAEGLVAVFLLTVLRVCWARWAREEGVASFRGATPAGLRSVMRPVKRPRPALAIRPHPGPLPTKRGEGD
jgi:hypothetical protein